MHFTGACHPTTSLGPLQSQLSSSIGLVAILVPNSRPLLHCTALQAIALSLAIEKSEAASAAKESKASAGASSSSSAASTPQQPLPPVTTPPPASAGSTKYSLPPVRSPITGKSPFSEVNNNPLFEASGRLPAAAAADDEPVEPQSGSFLPPIRQASSSKDSMAFSGTPSRLQKGEWVAGLLEAE